VENTGGRRADEPAFMQGHMNVLCPREKSSVVFQLCALGKVEILLRRPNDAFPFACEGLQGRIGASV
jgi:hypothetical protein